MNYKEIQAEILRLERESGQDKNRSYEAEKRLREGLNSLDTLDERFERTVLDGDEKAIKSVKAERRKVEESIEQDSALVRAIKGKMVKVEDELSSLKSERNVIFASLAKVWLRKEKTVYDRSVKEMLRRAKRLTVCYDLLRELNQGSVYVEEIPCYEYMPLIKAPVIENFDRSDFLSRSPFQRIPSGGREEVIREIVEEG